MPLIYHLYIAFFGGYMLPTTFYGNQKQPLIESINRHVEGAYITQPHPIVSELHSGQAGFHHIGMMHIFWSTGFFVSWCQIFSLNKNLGSRFHGTKKRIETLEICFIFGPFFTIQFVTGWKTCSLSTPIFWQSSKGPYNPAPQLRVHRKKIHIPKTNIWVFPKIGGFYPQNGWWK